MEGFSPSPSKSTAQTDVPVPRTAHLETRGPERYDLGEGGQRRIRFLLQPEKSCYQNGRILS